MSNHQSKPRKDFLYALEDAYANYIESSKPATLWARIKTAAGSWGVSK